MNEVVMLFTLQGQIIGELVPQLTIRGGVTLKNPALVMNQGTSVSFFPMTQFVDENEVLIPDDKMLFAGTFTPKQQMQNEYRRMFGAGIEITLLSAIPAGSGLGTSSILASTVLGAVNDFCGLAWDKNDICSYTLVLEQLLTTGGGWQDQYGGVFPGVKLLQSESGFGQHPLVRWLPDQLFVQPEYRDCHLLYYTGITRTAKGILAEIVSSMFLNSGMHLSLLAEMKAHAMDMNEAILRVFLVCTMVLF